MYISLLVILECDRWESDTSTVTTQWVNICFMFPVLALDCIHQLKLVVIGSHLQIQIGHRNTNGFIEDLFDGQLSKAHPLFFNDPSALQLVLYYDELEVTNPLGSKTGKHKLGKVGLYTYLHAKGYNISRFSVCQKA